MRWLRFAVFILVVTVLQAAVVDAIAVTARGIKPDLLLILLVFFSIYCDTGEAIITSFSIGFAADIIGASMGPQIISFGLVGTLVAYLHRIVAIRKMPYQALAVFAVSLLAAIISNLLTMLKGEPTINSYDVVFYTAVYSGIVGPFLFLPSAWLMHINMSRFTRR